MKTKPGQENLVCSTPKSRSNGMDLNERFSLLQQQVILNKRLKEAFTVKTLTTPSLQGQEPHCPALTRQIIWGEEVKKKVEKSYTVN